ncbi:unnamed protein product [Urochloa decumbens]|uniref:DUF3615 domain-containing protein n=1 Tax=Urochloa decumbens TaxID=240449 RepID=A0ABC9G1H1_9POAL
MGGAGVAARPGLVAASGSGGPSGIGSLVGATSATAGRQRKPGRWKRIPRYTQSDLGTENLTLGDPMDGTGVAARRGSVPDSDSGGSYGIGKFNGTTEARQRKPGRWKRIPRYTPTPPVRLEKPIVTMVALPPQGKTGSAPILVPGFQAYLPAREPRETREHLPSNTLKVTVLQRGSKEDQEMEELQRQQWEERAKRLEEDDEDLCDTEEAKVAFRAFKTKFVSFYRKMAARRPEDVVFNYKPPSDTQEEHLTAEEMEMKATQSNWPVCPQAMHFATLALDHYNSTKKMHKFEMARVLLSKCFFEADGTTFAHVNFTATTPQQSASNLAKRLFFAELMLIPDLQAYECAEPMRVLHVCTIDDSCFGGCHEMVRDIKGPVRKDLDYDRCHACSERIKHPRGAQFIAGHNRTRMPYVSVFPVE